MCYCTPISRQCTPISPSPLGRPCCSSVSSWTSRESDLTLSSDFDFVGVSPGEPGSPGSAEGQECHSRRRNERRFLHGRPRGARYACTTSEHRTVDTRFWFCSFTSLVASKDTGHGRSWMMVSYAQMEGFLRREHSFLDPYYYGREPPTG